MICKNCGKQIPDGSEFCGECGTAVSDPIEQEQVNNMPESRVYIPSTTDSNSDNTLIFILGLLALILSFFSGGLASSIAGISNGIACLTLSKDITSTGKALKGEAKAGKVLGIVGLINGIISYMLLLAAGIFIGILIFKSKDFSVFENLL